MRRDPAMTDDELLAAYCDGVTELSVDERKRVEALLASSETARSDEAATRSMIGALRDLPGEGTEPDWTAMERSIRAQVPENVPRQWWRPVWRWLVPVTALATMATLALLVFGREPTDRAAAHEREPVASIDDAGIAPSIASSNAPSIAPSLEPAPVADPGESVAMRLDGEDVVLDPGAADVLEVDDLLLGESDAGVEGLLSTDLAWIDELDEDDAAFAEKWLDERNKG
jgi:anti-sigma factor RsiW